MKFLSVISSTVLFVCLVLFQVQNQSLSAAEKSKAQSLFDGKSFSGWEGDTAQTWRIENGTITAGSLQKVAPRNEFLTTKKRYKNFDLSLKFKIVGTEKVNAGVQFRTERIPNHHEVSGFQADIGENVDGNLYDESRRRVTLVSVDDETLQKVKAASSADGWETYRIRANGNHIQLWRNGIQTVDYIEKDSEIAETGVIALQIHGRMKAIISYKDIQIVELPE